MSIGVASDVPLEARGFLLQMHTPAGTPREQKVAVAGARLDTVDEFGVLLALPRGPPTKTWYCGACRHVAARHCRSARLPHAARQALSARLPGGARRRTPRLARHATRATPAVVAGIPARLPSGVREMRLEMRAASPVHPEADGRDEEGALGSPGLGSPHRLQLTVEKRVPPVGWLLLGIALLTTNSIGPASDFQERNPPGAEPPVRPPPPPATPAAITSRLSPPPLRAPRWQTRAVPGMLGCTVGSPCVSLPLMPSPSCPSPSRPIAPSLQHPSTPALQRPSAPAPQRPLVPRPWPRLRRCGCVQRGVACLQVSASHSFC